MKESKVPEVTRNDSLVLKGLALSYNVENNFSNFFNSSTQLYQELSKDRFRYGLLLKQAREGGFNGWQASVSSFVKNEEKVRNSRQSKQGSVGIFYGKTQE
jgi:hypothetical protein